MAEEKKDTSVEATEEKETKEETKEEVKEENTVSEEKQETKEEVSSEKKEDKEEKKVEDKKEEKVEDKEEDDEEVEVPEKFKGIVEEIEKMTVVDLADLVSLLEKKFKVSAVASAPAGGGAASGGEEKSEVNIVLKEIGEKKIEVIKAVKEVTGLGLQEAKGIVDGAPGNIKEDVKREEAEEIKGKLEEAGATIALE
jgi:large subunit ribosomal protein L7/L12